MCGGVCGFFAIAVAITSQIVITHFFIRTISNILIEQVRLNVRGGALQQFYVSQCSRYSGSLTETEQKHSETLGLFVFFALLV